MKDGFEKGVGDDVYARLASEYCADSIVITDSSGRTEWVNEAFTRTTGYTLKDAKGELPCQLLKGPDTCRATMQDIQQARKDRQQFRTEIQQYTKEGRPFWFELRINPVFDADGRHTHFVETERDITERKELEISSAAVINAEAQREVERKLVAQTSEWLYSAKSLPELLRVVEASMREIFPEADGELYVYSNSRDTLDLIAHWGHAKPEHQHIAPDSCWGLRRGRPYVYGSADIQFACDHNQNDEHLSFCLPIMAHGETIGLLHLCFRDTRIADVEKAELDGFLTGRRDLALVCAEQISLSVANVQLRQELQDQSTRDPLTSLWNRRWFLEAALREFNRARRDNAPVSVISLDVDHFKKFNDHHGHDAGDIVLREVGEVMKRIFPDDCYPCRIGGEEFVVLCPGHSTDAAADLAEEFRAAISEHRVPYGREILPRITISGGIATFPDAGSEVITLLRAADECLYLAKEQGRNQIVLPESIADSLEKSKEEAARKRTSKSK